MTLIRRLGHAAALTALLAGLATPMARAATPDAKPAAPAAPEPLLPSGAAGAYLAASQASRDNDYSAAAKYAQVLVDGGVQSSAVMETAVQAQMALGDFAAAAKLAHQMQALGMESQAVQLALLAEALHQGAYEQVVQGISKGKIHIGALVDGLVSAWAELGAGKMGEATAAFDKLTKTPGMQSFGLYHKALALASVGDFEGAEKILSGRDKEGALQLTRQGVIARAEVLSQLERNAEAMRLLDADFPAGSDPEVDALRARLKAGETVPFTVARTPKDGLAQVFYSVGTALDGQAADSYVLVFARIAVYLDPGLAGAKLLAADILERQGQHALALAAYDSVGRDDPAYYAAESGKADTLYAEGDKDGATEVMARLAKAYPKVIEVQAGYANMLRRQEKWTEATAAYSRAIELTEGKQEPRFWSLYYLRGMAEERAGDWPAAEADLREALKLNPGQPDALNYLGYGLVDRGEKLDEALGMIKQAVAARPDDGYIADSLGWAYYRLGDYKKALPIMEKASELEPVDPVVTDHLGDVYWMVGRRNEARFQWQRALSYGPDEAEKARIRLKLEKGLDAVLKDEAQKDRAQKDGVKKGGTDGG